MLNSIQVLRAVAAWLVVSHHIMEIFFDFQHSGALEWFLVRRGMAGVDLFFVISGFIMVYITSESRDSASTFLSKRIIRVVPNYWFYTLLMAVVIQVVPCVSPITGFTFASLFQSLFFWPHSNPSGEGQFPLLTVGWSLNYEMFFYLMFAFSLFVTRSFRAPFLVASLLLITHFWPWRWSLDGFLRNPLIYEFLFGVVLATLYKSNRLPLGNPTLSVLAIVVAVTLFIMPSPPRYRPYFWGLVSMFIVYGFLGLERFFSGLHKLVEMGNWSYSTYLCHTPILLLLNYTHNHYFPSISTMPFVAAAIILIYLCSKLSYTHIELKTHGALTQVISTRKATRAGARIL